MKRDFDVVARCIQYTSLDTHTSLNSILCCKKDNIMIKHVRKHLDALLYPVYCCRELAMNTRTDLMLSIVIPLMVVEAVMFVAWSNSCWAIPINSVPSCPDIQLLFVESKPTKPSSTTAQTQVRLLIVILLQPHLCLFVSVSTLFQNPDRHQAEPVSTKWDLLLFVFVQLNHILLSYQHLRDEPFCSYVAHWCPLFVLWLHRLIENRWVPGCTVHIGWLFVGWIVMRPHYGEVV